jgi:trimeric autotransporter adhesin
VVPLVKAVQELSEANDSLKNEINNLHTQLNSIQQQISNLQRMAVTGTAFDAPILKQNAPNPFSNITIIEYSIPAKSRTAALQITNDNGQVLISQVLSSKGKGQTIIDGSELAAGTYLYSLVIDGKRVQTKKMVNMK